ncbi:hypothetical protein KDL44_14970 [bacterium]|nr:hypothetical protein [bacterium]
MDFRRIDGVAPPGRVKAVADDQPKRGHNRQQHADDQQDEQASQELGHDSVSLASLNAVEQLIQPRVVRVDDGTEAEEAEEHPHFDRTV